jgi:hypothetical protein
MGEAAPRRLDAIIPSDFGFTEQMPICLEGQLVGQLLAFLQRTGKGHDKTAAARAHDRSFETSKRVEIDDGTALWLLREIAQQARVTRRNVLDRAYRFFLRRRNVETSGDRDMDAAEAAAFLLSAGNDFLTGFGDVEFLERFHCENRPGLEFSSLKLRP